MLYPPERFDLNEWFSLLSGIVVFAAALLLPKRFSAVLTTVFVMFTLFISQTVDALIAVEPVNLYDVSDTSKYEIMDAFIYYFVYPPTTYLFLYFYDKWKPGGWRRVLYVAGGSFVSVVLEGLAHWVRVYTYKGWNLGYSFCVYLVVYAFYVWMYHSMIKLMNRQGIRTRR